jgi:hypothetical protein
MRLPAHHALEVFELRDAATHHLELEWDRRRGGESHDFRPRLPLTIYW